MNSKHSVFLIADQTSRGFFAHIPDLLNPCQSQFTFVLSTKVNETVRPDSSFDVVDALSDAFIQKLALSMRDDDLLVMLRRETLTAKNPPLTNLFLAGSTLKESPPRVAVISTRFIPKGIIKPDLQYLGQRHALYHLFVCSLLGSFLDLEAHADNGCLLDFNNFTPSIQRKIDSGYAFCDECHRLVQTHDCGDSIFKICAELKSRGHLDVAGISTCPALEFPRIKLAGTRSQDEAFESLCAQLYARACGPEEVQHVKSPDRGVDILISRGGKVLAVQCKFFVNNFGSSQVADMSKSYTAGVLNYSGLSQYIFALPRNLTPGQRQKVLSIGGNGPPVAIIDGDSLRSMISREPDLVRQFFE